MTKRKVDFVDHAPPGSKAAAKAAADAAAADDGSGNGGDGSGGLPRSGSLAAHFDLAGVEACMGGRHAGELFDLERYRARMVVRAGPSCPQPRPCFGLRPSRHLPPPHRQRRTPLNPAPPPPPHHHHHAQRARQAEDAEVAAAIEALRAGQSPPRRPLGLACAPASDASPGRARGGPQSASVSSGLSEMTTAGAGAVGAGLFGGGR